MINNRRWERVAVKLEVVIYDANREKVADATTTDACEAGLGLTSPVGLQPGVTYGSTDDLGYAAQENPVSVHDFHATMLHLLGVDHKRLTFRFGGRDMRLTDVHGEVVKEVVA